ncbi:Uncharacterized protein Fot_43275 [Forsythia ovata]|uniref:Uncharacterized protein n=1 Tax=Forsythia ovata TaxID=205694 RepID=A0ABD1RQE3_9LAMI
MTGKDLVSFATQLSSFFCKADSIPSVKNPTKRERKATPNFKSTCLLSTGGSNVGAMGLHADWVRNCCSLGAADQDSFSIMVISLCQGLTVAMSDASLINQAQFSLRNGETSCVISNLMGQFALSLVPVSSAINRSSFPYAAVFQWSRKLWAKMK